VSSLGPLPFAWQGRNGSSTRGDPRLVAWGDPNGHDYAGSTSILLAWRGLAMQLFPEVERRILASPRPLLDHLLRDPTCRQPNGHSDEQRNEKTGSRHVRSGMAYIHNMVICRRR
jgi:hypothetical protein